MDWAIGVFLVVMIGLYIWSHVTAGHAIGKKMQPFIDDLFGVSQKSGCKPQEKKVLGQFEFLRCGVIPSEAVLQA